MDVLRHWLVVPFDAEAETFLAWDAETADEYRQQGYRVDGPFDRAAYHPRGAVEESDRHAITFTLREGYVFGHALRLLRLVEQDRATELVTMGDVDPLPSRGVVSRGPDEEDVDA